MIKENKIKKYVVVIICLLGMLILSGKTENVFANDKKSKDMENSLNNLGLIEPSVRHG